MYSSVNMFKNRKDKHAIKTGYTQKKYMYSSVNMFKNRIYKHVIKTGYT